MARRKSAKAAKGRAPTEERPGRGSPGEFAPLLLALLLTALAASVLIWMLARFWPFTVDDSYITLRYAANLAAGHGPVYNFEPPRAEGYTSALWMALLALPHLAGLDAVLVAKLLGAALTVGYVALAFWLVAELSAFLGRRARFLPAAMTAFWLAAHHPTAVHAVSGMETALAAFLLTLLVLCAALARSDRALALLPAIGLLLGLTRPEANPVVALILGYCFFVSVPAEGRRRFGLWVLALYVLPGALYFGWRVWYFGELFPIPFYLKVASQELLAGKDTALSFLGTLLVCLGFPLAGAVLRLNRQVLLILGVAAVWVGLCLFPAHIMDYEARFCFPAAPLLFALAGYGLAVWLSQLEALFAGESRSGSAVRLACAVALVVLASWLALSQRHAEMAFDRRSYGMALEHSHVRLGKILADFPVAEGERRPLLAIGDAGAVPYYSRWRVVDTFGLNDPVIGIEGNRDPRYVLDQDPDLVVLVSREQVDYRTHETVPWEGRLYEAVREAGMARIAVISFSPRSHLWVMGDSRSEIARYLARQMRKLMAERERAVGNE